MSDGPGAQDGPAHVAGELPPWPDDPPGGPAARRAALDDDLADLEERVAELVQDAAPALREAVGELLELHRRRVRAADDRVGERLGVLTRVQAELAQLRRLPSTDAMIAAAPRAVCAACGFDRAVLYRVRGRELLAEAFHVEGDPDAAARLLAFSRAHPAGLVSPAIEADLVRRRRPMAVQQGVGDPEGFAELAAAYDTRSYVAAPIMPEGRVIGFLHADHRLKPRRVDDADSAALWAFAEGFGHAVERARLADRLRAQGQELRRLLVRTEAVVAEYLEAEVELAGDASGSAGASRAAAALVPEARPDAAAGLTDRETEVLALVATGAGNADIAVRLFITEETVKSHVQRILRKLGAANRVEAATIWLRSRPPRG